jgi:hypothetical protein
MNKIEIIYSYFELLTKMPISTCLNPEPSRKCAAIWTFIPDEEINFNKFYFVKILRIECFNPAEEIEDPSYHPPRKIHPKNKMSRYYYHWSNTQQSLTQGPYILPSLKNIFPKLNIVGLHFIHIKLN